MQRQTQYFSSLARVDSWSAIKNGYLDQVTVSENARLIPTGTCWCGCGEQVGIGAFFARGHDKVAEAALLAAKYGGSVAQMLHGHGFGDVHSVTAEAVEKGHWERCAHDGCRYVGAPNSVRSHREKARH